MKLLELNVVYGMYSGLALLLDVHRPEQSNGYGIGYINGSGWHRDLSYNAEPLKELAATATWVSPLVSAGYTVFVINHRAAPRFRYPDAVEDAQRAVRWVRCHADVFGIRPDRIGATGGSSGGHLVSLLGVLPGDGDLDDPDPVNQQSARVQCVVSRAAPVDLISHPANASEADFLGMVLRAGLREGSPTSLEYRTYRNASPLFHVTADAPPFLMIHGDADEVVPFGNSESMRDALTSVGVPNKLIRVPNANHGPDFPGALNPPDYLGEMVEWFDSHLRSRRPRSD